MDVMMISYILGGFLSVFFASLVVKIVCGWFSAVEPVSYFKALLTELAFVVGAIVIQLLLVLTFSALGLTIDFVGGMAFGSWILVGVTSLLFSVVFGGIVFSLVLPLSFVLGSLACLFSHLFMASLVFVILTSVTDVRISFPVKRPPITVVSNASDVDSLVTDEPVEVVPEPEKPKVVRIVNRSGFRPVPISGLRKYIHRTVRYRLPNGVTKKGTLLGVKKDFIEIMQSEGGGSITYTVLIKELRRIEAFETWQEEVSQ